MPPLSLARKEPLEPTLPWCYAPVWVWEKKNMQHTQPGEKATWIHPLIFIHFFFFFFFRTLRLSDTDGYWNGFCNKAMKPHTLFLSGCSFQCKGNFPTSKLRNIPFWKHCISLKRKKKWSPVLTETLCTKMSLQVQIWFCWFVFPCFLIGFSWELSLELCFAVTSSETGSCLSALLTNWKSGCRVDFVEASNRGVPLNLSGSNLHQTPVWRSKVVCLFFSFISSNQMWHKQMYIMVTDKLGAKILMGSWAGNSDATIRSSMWDLGFDLFSI